MKKFIHIPKVCIPSVCRRAFLLARKEFYQYMYMPAFYGAVVFFLLSGSIWLFYFQQYFAQGQASLRPYFAVFPVLFILIIPVITMRSWAEERKTGTVELLLTLPFTEWELVLGKFLSILGVLSVMLLLTLPLPLSLLRLGRFDFGLLLCEYLGAFLLGASAGSLGLLFSSISKNQAGSFLGSAVILLVLMLINQITFALNLPNRLAGFLDYFSLSYHFASFSKGIIDTRDAAFFILSSFLFLFINTRVILFRKWK